jgi:hypothetical protein
MPTFDTPGPIAATVVVAGAQVRVTASDRTDTVVLVEPINKASKKDVKVVSKTKVDFADGQLSVKTTVSGDEKGSVVITIGLRHRLGCGTCRSPAHVPPGARRCLPHSLDDLRRDAAGYIR